MCLEAMDTRSKHSKADRLRKTMRPAAAKLRWKVLRVATEEEEKEVEAFNLPCRTTAMKSTTNRRHPCREQRRAQLAKLSKILEEMDSSNNKLNKKKIKKEKKEEAAAACAGAMAPENTTQYLMSNVYADLKSSDTQAETASHETASQLYGESLSPSSVYSALDRGYESCLAFQQRDFDALFDLW